MQITKCDRCGAEIEKTKSKFRVQIEDKMCLAEDEVIEDLCDHCRNELCRFLSMADYYWDTHDPSGGDLPAEDQARQQEKNDKEKKKGTPRRTVDYGKLLALRNAGWSLKKIAEEVHMTESGVSLAIRKAKEEKLKNEGGNL